MIRKFVRHLLDKNREKEDNRLRAVVAREVINESLRIVRQYLPDNWDRGSVEILIRCIRYKYMKESEGLD